MIDLRVRGGLIYSPEAPIRSDLLVRDGVIAALVGPDEEVTAAETIDADGLVVLPGLVDLHAHMRTPGYSHKEDFRTGSMAAAAGGYTTWVDMPNVDPPTTDADTLRDKRELALEESLIDFGHFASGSNPETIAELAKAGATGFKIFMIGGGYPHDDRIAASSDADLWQSFEAIAPTGLPCLVHPFNQALFDLFSEKELAAGRPRTFHTRAEIYTNRDVVWSSAVETAIHFHDELGVRLHLLHTHAVGSIARIRAAKARGLGVTAAIDPKYFHLTEEEMQRLGPRSYHGAWITGDERRLETIWNALADGTIDIIDSDHAPHTLDEIAHMNVDAWKAQGGSPQYDDLLMVLLDDVNRNRLPLATLARLLTENPAKLIGHYPNKGSLLPGTDADIVLIDMEKTTRLTDDRILSKAGWTPYQGRNVKGAPVRTISRGRTVARDGQIVDGPEMKRRARFLGGVAQFKDRSACRPVRDSAS
ncbi:MAG: amidohydrolase family protein [Acidimicrobiia bacterium]|nr:amidohydrolase family protein [Acidimicrobiia bacterium]